MKKLRLFIIRKLAEKFLNIVTTQDVLRIIGRGLTLGDSRLSDEECGILKEEASAFTDSMLWKYAKRNVEYLASEKMGRNAKSQDDILVGNAMFYNLSIIEEFVNKLRKL